MLAAPKFTGSRFKGVSFQWLEERNVDNEPLKCGQYSHLITVVLRRRDDLSDEFSALQRITIVSNDFG